MNRQQVIPRGTESGDGRHAADAAVWPMAVVMVLPTGERFGSMSGVLERPAVRPFTKRRLDEPLGLAVGLGALGPSEFVTDAERLASVGELAGSKCRSVVSQ